MSKQVLGNVLAGAAFFIVAIVDFTRDQVPFRELGPDWLARRHSVEHRTRRLVKQLEALGHAVTLEAAA